MGTRRATNNEAAKKRLSQRLAKNSEASTEGKRAGSRRSVACENFVGSGTGDTTATSAVSTLRSIPVRKVIFAAVLLLLLIFGLRFCMSMMPITVNINGADYELRGSKTLQSAIKQCGRPLNPGDLISLRGNVLKRTEGEPFNATVNGQKVADPDAVLQNGDVVVMSDGEDIIEDADVVTRSVPYGVRQLGSGALHKYTKEGSEGVITIKTGKLSGEVVEKQTTDPVDLDFSSYNPNVGTAKVVALTFDDGPDSRYTGAILDILAENNVKATFFTVGAQIEMAQNAELVKRAYDEGHQVGTRSYDFTLASTAPDFSYLKADTQVEQVERGRAAISNAIGAEASTVVRLPTSNITKDMILALDGHITAEVQWTRDTADWAMPGADAVYEELMAIEPGDIVICHDGGGDCSQTVEALKKALPELIKKGFEFVTVDEMLEYPAIR